MLKRYSHPIGDFDVKLRNYMNLAGEEARRDVFIVGKLDYEGNMIWKDEDQPQTANSI